jgi:uncharacterized protein (TIGR03435 family)
MFRSGCWLVFAAMSAFGQATVAMPEFEVAAIKPSNPDSTMAIKRSGHRLNVINFSLEKIILWAYDIPDDHLFGQPKFLASEHYDITAESAEGPAVRGEFRQMMQSLLKARFKLAVHRETREKRVLVLVVDPKGVKIHPVESDEPIGQNPFAGSRTGHYVGTKVNTEMLAKALSDIMERSVEDGTGLKGLFDFTLDWTPDTSTSATGPSITTALQEQLGLRVESRRRSVEVIVIDHVESAPTEN